MFEFFRHLRARSRLKRAILSADCVRLVLGASGIAEPGWIATDQDTLDVADDAAWARYFKPGSIDAIMAEHMWEHLPTDVSEAAANLCFKYLKPSGHARIAVPDGHHPDPAYIDGVRPGGNAAGAKDHKVLFTHDSISAVFTAAGFVVEKLEYFDAAGQFHFIDWLPEGGKIRRSRRFDPRNQNGDLVYTSVIIDAFKPESPLP